MVVQDYVSVLLARGIVLMPILARFTYKPYHTRSPMLSLRRRGLVRYFIPTHAENPQLLTISPPHHPILGQLIFYYQIAAKMPFDAHPAYLPDMIRRELPGLGLII